MGVLLAGAGTSKLSSLSKRLSNVSGCHLIGCVSMNRILPKYPKNISHLPRSLSLFVHRNLSLKIKAII